MLGLKSLLVLLVVCISTVHGKYKLRHLDTEYIPSSYNPEEFEYNVGAAEQSAVDQNQPIIYVSGLNFIHVVDISNPSNLQRPYFVQVAPDGSGEGTDVETCDSLVAVSYDNFVDPLDGRVFIYTAYDASAAEPMQCLFSIPVGAVPDMVKFTHDCSKLIVAVEAELRVVNGEVVDPEGQVAIIDLQQLPQEPTVKIASFRPFNDREDEYVARGVRRVYTGEGTSQSTTFAQDLEPEYIAINSDDTIAYIGLQENNAVAAVDISSACVIEIYPLGTKQFDPPTIDPSDMDGGIKMNPWPVKGIPQPDGVAYIKVAGVAYLITANEGDVKEYEEPDFPFEWTEAQRGRNFSASDFASSVPGDVIKALGNNTQLGRLELSVIDGIDSDGKYTDLFSFGSRSFSMYRVTDFTRVYDSGDELERVIAENFPTIFNSNPKYEYDTPEETRDSRSDDRGPEVEAIGHGTTSAGDELIFVGVERPGFVCIYRLTSDDGLPELTFNSINYGGGYGKPWGQLYEERIIRDLDPEDLRFIPASRGISKSDLLAVTATYTGTVSLYEVYDDEDDSKSKSDSHSGSDDDDQSH